MATTEVLVPTEEELDQARVEREGMQMPVQGGVETTQPSGPLSTTKISDRAFDLIVEFEVSSEQVYTRKYRSTVWPGGASGVTIGIGYDVGYATKAALIEDFGDLLPVAMINVLSTSIGKTGEDARIEAYQLAASVDVPWNVAIRVHRERVIPRWIGLVERSLSNTNAIGPDALGALVSLTYNRGASFQRSGDRFTEMRAIRSHMADLNFWSVPDEFRSMKRLWPRVTGLQKRREREAQLFASRLSIT